ncbi:hypothetical protein [Bacillus pumilus]|uniref:Uncharacterized protein n=1 Tax=Bacillus pumilus TaxID=1408 RepID=A0AAD0MMD7_BACPU|nr:hypothetical protein [Bacillus pumilus]AVM25529.1 hypothetical protein C5695_17455 [Bacillus pumilus]TYS43595.1 hypothetical protein FZC68_05840 [Bacillus pumilus]
MKDYTEILEIDTRDKVNKYLEEGWEIIDTLKIKYPEQDFLKFVIGYPASKKIEDLKAIIRRYEEANLKVELFKSIADNNGHDFNEIEEDSNYGDSNATTDYMNFYEKTMGNEKQYSKKLETKLDIEF